MKNKATFLEITKLLILCVAMTSSSEAAQTVDPAYKIAYEKWRDLLDASPLDVGSWFRTDIDNSEIAKATRVLFSIGPNLTPLIVEELKTEKDPLRLYRLMLLLDRVSGINIYFESGVGNFYEATPELRDRFIAQWDSGLYLSASELLKNEWQNTTGESGAGKIDPRNLTPIRRYGVYALPFILESLNQRNSNALFAAYLVITGERDLYSQYIENPAAMFSTPDHKLSHIKQWLRTNENKFEKLGNLHNTIRAMLK